MRRCLSLLPCLLFLLAPASSRAEETGPPREHTLGVAVGYEQVSVLDRAATALPYEGRLAPVGVDYAGRRGPTRWFVRLDAAYGGFFAANHAQREVRFVTVETDGTRDEVVVPMRGSMLATAASAGATRSIALGRDTELALGASLRWDIVYPQGFAAPGMMQLVSTEASVGIRHRLSERQEIALALATPLFGVITRLPYHQSVSAPGESRFGGFVHGGTRFASWDSLVGVSLDATYALRVGRHGSIGFAYGFRFLRDTEPRLLQSGRSRFALVLRYRFGGPS